MKNLRLLLILGAFSQFSFAESPAVRPILLVPGWGYNLYPFIFLKTAWNPYLRWFQQEGFPAKDIHILRYHYEADLDTIGQEVTTQLQTILASYPPGTQFDIMGHSEGAFVALYAMMISGLSSHFKKYISLAGIPQGWDSNLCAKGLCGKADEDLIPWHSPLVMNFLTTYAAQIHALDKCSLYSPADQFVKPYDAAKFDDGTNIEVPDMRHMQWIWTLRGFETMRAGCYGIGTIPTP
jgi:pimeloyl-ACP methyl ester carboxylesterase